MNSTVCPAAAACSLRATHQAAFFQIAAAPRTAGCARARTEKTDHQPLPLSLGSVHKLLDDMTAWGKAAQRQRFLLGRAVGLARRRGGSLVCAVSARQSSNLCFVMIAQFLHVKTSFEYRADHLLSPSVTLLGRSTRVSCTAQPASCTLPWTAWILGRGAW